MGVIADTGDASVDACLGEGCPESPVGDTDCNCRTGEGRSNPIYLALLLLFGFARRRQR